MALFEKCFEGGKITVKNMVRENLDKGRTTSFDIHTSSYIGFYHTCGAM